MQWLRKHWTQLAAYLLSFRKSSTDSGATKPVRKLTSIKKRKKPRPNSRWPYDAVIWLLVMLPLSGCATSATKPPQDSAANRPCFQWLITKDQEVYVYENGSLIARLETEPFDGIISGWCILKFSGDTAREITHLNSHPWNQ